MKTIFALLILTLVLQETLSCWSYGGHQRNRRFHPNHNHYRLPTPYSKNKSGFKKVHTGGKAFARGNGYHGSANSGSKSGPGGSNALGRGAVDSETHTHYADQSGFKSNHFGF